MAISVTTDSSPNPTNIGVPTAESIQLLSGETSGVIDYQIQAIENLDNLFQVSSSLDLTATNVNYPQVISVDNTQLRIILTPRTRYRFRIQIDGGGFGAWTDFKTRDKLYDTPSTVLQQSTTEAAATDGATITVTDTALATTVLTTAGATVTYTANANRGQIAP